MRKIMRMRRRKHPAPLTSHSLKATDLARKAKIALDIVESTPRRPIVIIRHSRPVAVLLSHEFYQQLTNGKDDENSG